MKRSLGREEDSKMANSSEVSAENDVLAGLLSASNNLESLESLEAAFTTGISRSSGSFRSKRHASESVSPDMPRGKYII